MTATPPDFTLRPLTQADVPALFAFEQANRDWFARWVGPRPPNYDSEEALGALVAAQLAEADGDVMFIALVGGKIVGRVNLYAVEGHVGQLGFRFGEAATGKGLATRAVALVLDEARARGLWTVEAQVSSLNPASRRVLDKTGFRPVATIDPPEGMAGDAVLMRCALA